jgi:hypothetical protein
MYANMTIKPPNRFVGGFSKLIAAFIKKYNPSTVTTFIDKRYGKGSYLTDLGFKAQVCYPSFGWTDGKNVIHRFKYKGNDGYKNKLHKIWDCGQQKWIKIL